MTYRPIYVRLLCAPCSKLYEIAQGERPICPRCNGALRVVSARVGVSKRLLSL